MVSTFAIRDANEKLGKSSRALIDKVAKDLKKDSQMKQMKKDLGESFFS